MNTQNLEQLVQSFYFKRYAINQSDFNEKSHPDKWSKKEILGHLIDSAINNLQRFTEIHHASEPFHIKGYNQNELVIANQYQKADLLQLIDLWKALNERIIAVIRNLNSTQLEFQIITPDKNQQNVSWLINDYRVHLEHHLSQLNV